MFRTSVRAVRVEIQQVIDYKVSKPVNGVTAAGASWLQGYGDMVALR